MHSMESLGLMFATNQRRNVFTYSVVKLWSSLVQDVQKAKGLNWLTKGPDKFLGR